MKSYRLRTAAVAAVAVAGGTLSACAPVQAGAAAIVGKERITYSDLDAKVRSFQQDLRANGIPEEEATSLPPVILYNMATNRQIIEFGRMKGIKVTEGEIDGVINTQQGEEQFARAVLLRYGIPRPEGRTFVRAWLTRQKLMTQYGAGNDDQSRQAAAEKVAKEADTAVPIKFSPRYGKFDPERQTFIPDDRFGAPPAAALDDPVG